MTELLEKAFREISKLPEAVQNIFAHRLLDELDSERQWDSTFAKSEDLLALLAEEALAEHRQGKTKLLVPENL